MMAAPAVTYAAPTYTAPATMIAAPAVTYAAPTHTVVGSSAGGWGGAGLSTSLGSGFGGGLGGVGIYGSTSTIAAAPATYSGAIAATHTKHHHHDHHHKKHHDHHHSAGAAATYAASTYTAPAATTIAAPAVTYAAPTYTAPAATMMAAPAVTYAAPTYTAPATTTIAAPIVTYAAPTHTVVGSSAGGWDSAGLSASLGSGFDGGLGGVGIYGSTVATTYGVLPATSGSTGTCRHCGNHFMDDSNFCRK